MNTSIDAFYGSHYLLKDTLDTFLWDRDSATFSKYATIVGLSFAKSFAFGESSQDAFFTVQYQLPNTVNGKDSIDYIFSGYQIGISLGGKDLFYKNQQFDLVYGWGVQFGSYRLKRQHRTIPILSTRSKNGIIAPQLLVEARYFIGDLKLGFKMRVQYDISNTNWKHLDPSTIDFGGFSAKGYAFQGVIGYKLN